MAASLGRVCKSGLLKSNYGTLFNQVCNFELSQASIYINSSALEISLFIEVLIL